MLLESQHRQLTAMTGVSINDILLLTLVFQFHHSKAVIYRDLHTPFKVSENLILIFLHELNFSRYFNRPQVLIMQMYVSKH